MEHKSILVTGGAGFIGSHLIEHLLSKYDTYTIINIDALTYAGDSKRLENVASHPRYQFINGNICNAETLESLFYNYNIKGIFHLAAESHVDNSISNPEVFIETNIKGTFRLLEAAKKHWLENKNLEDFKFLHVSTDEVYGSLGAEGFFSEHSPYAPNSPYSASKAASDFLVRSYYHTYGLPVLITNCSNNYGPKQHDEKLIPTVIRKALRKENIPIYGNGGNIRDWMYVTDHCTALDKIFHEGRMGESYVIGTKNEQTNLNIAHLICKILTKIRPLSNNNYLNLITAVSDRAGHDFRYAIDNTKLLKELKWQPSISFENGLEQTIKWYINYYKA